MASFQVPYTPAKNQRDKKALQRSRWDFLRRHQLYEAVLKPIFSDDFAGFFENSADFFYQHIISAHFVKLFQKKKYDYSDC